MILWDSITRHRNDTLRQGSVDRMLDTLNWTAKTAREQTTSAAQSLSESGHLIGDLTLPLPLVNARDEQEDDG